MPEARLAGGAVDGLRLHYVSEGRGPATLLIHGLGGFAESWRRTVAELARHGTVIALDLPGFGRSAKPRVNYRLSFHAEAVEGLRRALGLERVRLVGHSMGGAVAVAYLMAHAPRVERLALLGAAVPGFPLRPSLVYRLMVVRGVGELFARMMTPRLCAAGLERCLVDPDPDEIDFIVRHEYAARVSPEGRAAYLSTLRAAFNEFAHAGDAYRAALSRLDRPVLVVHGRQDRVVAPDHAGRVVDGVPGAQGRWLDRCGHFPHIEQAALVNEWLGEFLYAPAGSR